MPNEGPAEHQSVSIDQHKESFAAATSSYFSILSSLDVQLRRQISALEEAEILPTEVFSKEVQTNVPRVNTKGNIQATPAIQSSEKEGIIGGGLGSLDVDWLNAKNDHVGKRIEADLWEESQRLVEKALGEKPHRKPDR